MDQKKIIIGNKSYEVVSFSDYINNQNIFNPQYTAIETEDYVLPIIPPSALGERIGAVCTSQNTAMHQVHLPQTEEEKAMYSKDNITDFSKATNVKELIKMQESIRDIENELLVSPENIFVPRITNEDTSEMKALKEAIISKGIDFKNYERRFGINAPNDKRGLSETSVSFKKLKRYAKAFDMKITLEISDASSDVPNPMRKVISKDITDDGEE